MVIVYDVNEYVISAKDEPTEWFDKVASHKGVKEITRDLKYILIESSPEIIEQLEKQYPYLKIEMVMV